MNNSFLVIFIASHLIGDFVLQTNKIARMKAHNLKGVGFHILIIAIVQLAFLSLFGLKGILAAFISTLLHFFIDTLKLYISKYVDKISFIYFLVDQAFHISIILFISKFISLINQSYTYLTNGLNLVIILIISTYVSSVGVKILIRDVYPQLRIQPLFLNKERLIDSVLGLIILLCALIGIIFNLWYVSCLSILIVLIASYLYGFIQKKYYNYSNIQWILKLIIIGIFVSTSIFINQLLR